MSTKLEDMPEDFQAAQKAQRQTADEMQAARVKVAQALKMEIALDRNIATARMRALEDGYAPDDLISVEMLSTGQQKHLPVWCWYLAK